MAVPPCPHGPPPLTDLAACCVCSPARNSNSAQGLTDKLSKGQIAAAIVAIVVGFVLVCMMLWYLCTRRLRQRSRLNSSENDGLRMQYQ